MTLLALIFAAQNAAAGFDGLSLTLGGTLGAAIVGGLVKIYTSRKHAEETKIPQPCEIHETRDCITVQECNRRMNEFNSRLCTVEQKLGTVFQTILTKLDEMDSKSEKRSIDLHRRVDVISEKTAETAGAVELIKAKMFKTR